MNVLLMLISGALLNLALPTFGLWPFLLALCPLFVMVARSPRPGAAFRHGFLFGVAFFTLHLLWFPVSFTAIFGSVSWILYPPMILLLGVFWGLVTWASRRLGGRGAGALWLLPALWVLMEWARTQGPFAFPWGALGYVWLDTPVAQLADITGVYGLSLLAAVLAALVAAPFLTLEPAQRYAPLITALALLLGGFVYGGYRLATLLPQPDRQALLVQGATDPLGRTVFGEEAELGLYSALTREGVAAAERVPDLVIWPEGAALDILYLRGEAQTAAWQQVQESAGGATALIGGGASANGDDYNSAFAVIEGRPVDRYDKMYPVPYGESVPFRNVLGPIYNTVYGWFGFGTFRARIPGDDPSPLTTPDGDAAVYICYEAAFPQVSRAMVRRGGNVLVNISNDAWFGEGQGAQQHFMMGTMRAIETRRYLLRVGNDGITGLVDPLGRVHETLPRYARDTLLVNYALRDEVTPYVRLGDYVVVVLAVGVFVFVAVRLVLFSDELLR